MEIFANRNSTLLHAILSKMKNFDISEMNVTTADKW